MNGKCFAPTAKIHLVLFLSRATPLSRWDRLGILERELAVYKKMANKLGSVSILTSGGEEELRYQECLGDIRILYNRWKLSANLYSLAAPFLHWAALRQATIYKTNQPDGAWTAILAGWLHRKLVVVRAGYLWAELNRQEGGHGFKAKLMDGLQAFAFRQAQAVFLTTPTMRQQVAEAYRLPIEKINVIPNYADTETFHPMPEVEQQAGRICYIGRLNAHKNLDSLIRALAGLPAAAASLVLIGQGEQGAALERLAQELGVSAQFVGVIPNQDIPLEINRSQIFVLPSFSEGHPKALVEAMACGAAVVGADVEGIRPMIQHEQTGLLCPPTEEGLRQAIGRLLEDASLRARLGQATRQFIEQNYSLSHIVDLELSKLVALSKHDA